MLNNRLRVYKGDHKGSFGIVMHTDKETVTLETWNGAKLTVLEVLKEDCQHFKGKQQRKTRFAGDSHYNPLTETRDERYKRIVEKRDKARDEALTRAEICFNYNDYESSLFFNISQASLKLKYGMGDIAIYMGSVLDLAIQSKVVPHFPEKVRVAIGNAANSFMLGGSGVDGQISLKGGNALYNARLNLPQVSAEGDRCLVGDAVVTLAGDIDADCIVHAVGPNFHIYHNYSDAYLELYTAYYQMFTKAVLYGCSFIGVPLLSSSIFRARASLESVVATGLLAAIAFLKHNPLRIYFAAFNSTEQTCITTLFNQLNCTDFDNFVHENYDSYDTCQLIKRIVKQPYTKTWRESVCCPNRN